MTEGRIRRRIGGGTKILITGGAGFIGSCLIKLMLKLDPQVQLVNLDKLTYSGDLSRLKDVEKNPRYEFHKGDVANRADVEKAMEGCSGVIHLAAETHVDRSLIDGKEFFDTNITGTYTLLEAARATGVKKFVTVSTDEVYGSRLTGFFSEKDPMNATSPYSISKAAADMLTLSYAKSFNFHTVVTRGSNTYGPYQYPEKVIPLFVSNALSGQKLPLYGDGLQVRNWMHVEDHCLGILQAYHKGKKGEAYNIATPFYLKNMELTKLLLKTLDKPESLIQKVKDRVGHDRRYALTSKKLRALGWRDQNSTKTSLCETFLWYQKNSDWWKAIKEKKEGFKKYYAEAYAGRV